jgi:hypothetical protein
MSITEHHHGAYAGAGLFIGGFAWAMSTVLGPSYADYSCAKRTMVSGGLALAAFVLTIFGGLLSWRSSRLLQAINIAPTMPARNARLFLARVSMMAACLFALAIVFQLVASGIFNGCER